MLSSLRSLTAFALSLFAVLAFAAPAVAQDTPVGGLQQLPSPDDCLSTQGGAGPLLCTSIPAGVTDALSIAIPPDGKHAYIAASDGENEGSLATFTRSLTGGELSYDRCIADTNSVENCSTSITQLQGASYVVATNTHVYVASSTSGSVRGFSRNATTGVLTALGAPGGCIEEIGAPGCTDGDDGLAGVDHLVLSPDGEFLVAASTASDRIIVLDRNPATGALSNGTGVDQPDVEGLAFSPDGAFLYAVSGGTTNILRSYAFTAPMGVPTLTPDDCFRGTLSAPNACGGATAPTAGLNNLTDVLALPMDGGGWNVYTVGGGMTGSPGSSLARFTDAAGNGTLAANNCLRDNESTEACATSVNGILDATSISATPMGQFLFVTGPGDNAIAYFERDTDDGEMRQKAGANEKCVSDGDNECSAEDDGALGLTGVVNTAVAPDGRFLYSVSPDDDAVAAFAIQYAPTCPDITRDDVPAGTTVDITPDCDDANEPRETITIQVETQPDEPDLDEGSVEAVDTNGDGRNDTLRYDPEGFTGTTSFTYSGVDSQGNTSEVKTVTVTVLTTGAPVISVSDGAASEADGTMGFTFQRTGPTTATITVTYSTENDTAVAPGDYTSQTGQTVVFSPGETSETVNVAIADDNVDEETERFRVRITNATEDVGPTPAIADDLGIGTIADNDTAVASIGNATVDEDGGPASVPVTLSRSSTRTVTVEYSTAEGSATEPEDYEAPPANATVSFAPGETSATISIPIVDDNAVEETEEFGVTLANPTGGAQLGDTSGEVTIDDDEIPGISIADTGIAEGDSGTRNAAFAVTLNAPTSDTVTVNYATLNGSANSGSDYTASSGTVTFAPGETTKTVNVPVIGDTTEESDETFSVILATPSNATIADGTGVGTIQNDDRAPAPPPEEPPPPAPRTTMVIGDTGIAEGDAGTRNAVFTVALSQAATAPIAVDVATGNGTALGGQDYLATGTRLTFAPGETAKTFTVAVRGDVVPEADETFVVRLSNASGADIVRAVGTGTIANDDIRRRLPGLRFTVTPARDLTLPHVFTVRGSVVLPSAVSEAEGCGTGFVSAQYKNRGNTISTRRVVLDDDCEFRIRTPFNLRSRLRNAKRLKLTVRFLGNRYLSPRRAQAVFVRIRR